MNTNNWTREQLKLAFHLYCQLPFGKLHHRNPEIIQLAKLIGRTPSAVSMKLGNFSSLDPAITSTGRSGLGNASKADREIWTEFHEDWERLAIECASLRRQLNAGLEIPATSEFDLSTDEYLDDFTGETRNVITEQRIKQQFFRRAVLSSYRGRCCMTGLSEPRLLVASHIVPWSADRSNRLNPRNGLCLSSLHDKAFDQGLITLTDNFRIILSDALRSKDEPFIKQAFIALEGHAIELPERFLPTVDFVAYHRQKVFLDNRAH